MFSGNFFPVLAPEFVLRKLESPHAYNIPEDELYELDDEAFEFLLKCDGKHPFSDIILEIGEDGQEDLEYMLNEGIILMPEFPSPRKIKAEQSPIPSLRYLLFNITDKCNLTCKHCYLGSSENLEIEPDVFEKTISQFEEMGGLKLMISGGEPLLHSRFPELMDILTSYNIRKIIISNGTLIGGKEAKLLSDHINEVQVSLDGINSNDRLRGKGSYEKAMTGIAHLQKLDVPVSIATMVHKYNINEFDDMQEIFTGLNTLSWSVDVPCVTGNLKDNPEFSIDMKEAARFLKYGFGSGAHESTGNYTCGSHLCSVSPDGTVSRCGFFDSDPVGDVNDLMKAWKNVCDKYLWTLDELECRECEIISDCRGGCRFRAKMYKGILSPDPLLCHANDIQDFL